MELKQQLKQFAGSSMGTTNHPHSSGGDRQACTIKKIEKRKQQAFEVTLSMYVYGLIIILNSPPRTYVFNFSLFLQKDFQVLPLYVYTLILVTSIF